MPRRVAIALFIALFATLIAFNLPRGQAADERNNGPMLAHMVFFTLKDKTSQNREKLAAACRKYLSDHAGTVYFSAGARAEEFDREVNDREFDVALHVVFKDKAAHDTYQDHPRHIEFINENRASWAEVRVFDSYVRE
jgi:hypothetical protein